MKHFRFIFFILFTLLFNRAICANTGNLFNVSATGLAANINITLCLNGFGAVTCQNYDVDALNLSILTTVPNKTYPSVGIKINTPGYAALGCTLYQNNFCIFSAQDKSPTTINVRSINSYTIGGRVYGLAGNVILQNNDEQPFLIQTDGEFASPVASTTGSSYNIHIARQPIGQTCTVSRGVGVVDNGNVDTVEIVCSRIAYTLGGLISGLDGKLTLETNLQNPYTITNNGIFTMPTEVAQGSPYSVTVSSQPTSQTCTVNFGDGIATSNNNNLRVFCSSQAYTVGGSVSDLVGNVVLILNADTNNKVTVSSSGVSDFTFPYPLAAGSFYQVGVYIDPENQKCAVSNGSGTIGNKNVTNVRVNCVNVPQPPEPVTLVLSSANIVIPVNPSEGITGSIEILNDNPIYVYNVHAEIPSGWPGVKQDSTDCEVIPPLGSCQLKFTSTTPYIAQGGIKIVGENVAETEPKSVTVAFSMDDYLIWAIPNISSVSVLQEILTRVEWNDNTKACSNIPGINEKSSVAKGDACDGKYDGRCDSQQIYNCMSNAKVPDADYAAGVCYSKTSDNTGSIAPGTWYLPAVCELGTNSFGGEAGCTNVPNISTNLYYPGALPGVKGDYWASTTYSYTAGSVWCQNFDPPPSYSSVSILCSSGQILKYFCARTITVE